MWVSMRAHEGFSSGKKEKGQGSKIIKYRSYHCFSLTHLRSMRIKRRGREKVSWDYFRANLESPLPPFCPSYHPQRQDARTPSSKSRKHSNCTPASPTYLPFMKIWIPKDFLRTNMGWDAIHSFSTPHLRWTQVNQKKKKNDVFVREKKETRYINDSLPHHKTTTRKRGGWVVVVVGEGRK